MLQVTVPSVLVDHVVIYIRVDFVSSSGELVNRSDVTNELLLIIYLRPCSVFVQGIQVDVISALSTSNYLSKV